MKISIHKKIFEKFPGLHTGILVVSGSDNSGDDKKIFELLEKAEELIRFEFTPETFTDTRLIPKKTAKHKLISVWKAAYEDLGFDPEHYQTNLEKMMVQIISGKKLPRSNKLVDCYTYVSLKKIIPIAGYDSDLVNGSISIGLATGKEKFVIDKKIMHPKKGEVIYYDNVSVLARNWNSIESTRAKITENTKNAIIFIEGLPPITKNGILKTLDEVNELVEMFCKGKSNKYILSILKNKVEL